MPGRVQRWGALTGIIAAVFGFTAYGQTGREALMSPAQLTEQAPETFRARFDTSRGPFVIEVQREWAPRAADRFYNLVKHGFYDDTRFFRVLSGFMVQFGLSGDPAISSAWRMANLPDEAVGQSNTRGMVSFTRESAPHSRYTMIFINYKDNSYLDADGFAPFGRVASGMDVVDALYGGYGRQNVPDQRRIMREGNAYLAAEYPLLDFVKSATIEPVVAGVAPPAPTAWGTQSAPGEGGGVYTSAQASRGQAQYEQHCAQCHGASLGGEPDDAIPALAWDPFFAQWSGRTAEDLVGRIVESMPPDAPGTIGRPAAIDLVAYILQENGFPEGREELADTESALSAVDLERPRPN